MNNRIMEGEFISTGLPERIETPFPYNSFEMWNLTAPATKTADTTSYAFAYATNAVGQATLTNYDANQVDNTGNSASAIVQITEATPSYGPSLTITGITAASPAVVTTSAAHGLQTGDAVLLTGTTEMLQIAGEVYTVTVLSGTTFSINVDASGFTAATGGIARKYLYPDLYIPFRTIITAIELGTITTLTTSVNHRFKVGQKIAFRIPREWGTVELDTFNYNKEKFVYQYVFVSDIPAPDQITVNLNSSGYTEFAYPTSATAAMGIDFPAVMPTGDINTGNQAVPPFSREDLTIPGAFLANGTYAVVISASDGTSTIHSEGDLVRYRMMFPLSVRNIV